MKSIRPEGSSQLFCGCSAPSTFRPKILEIGSLYSGRFVIGRELDGCQDRPLYRCRRRGIQPVVSISSAIGSNPLGILRISTRKSAFTMIIAAAATSGDLRANRKPFRASPVVGSLTR